MLTLFPGMLLGGWGQQADAHTSHTGRGESTVRAIVLTLEATPDESLDLFTPQGERGWDPDWNPSILYVATEPPVRSVSVFLTGSSGEQAVWVMSDYDRTLHHIRYERIVPHMTVTVIDIRCAALGPGRTKAIVTFLRTALSADGAADVRHLAGHFTEQGPHWEMALNDFLARKHRTRPQ